MNLRARILPLLRPALLLLPVLTVIALSFTSPTAQRPDAQKKVLILASDEAFVTWQSMVERAMRSTMLESPTPVEVYAEYLDRMRTDSVDYEPQLVSLLRQKYQGKNFDLIFANSDFSLRILLKHRSELFPGIPIVFVVMDQRQVADIDLGSGVTGVLGEIKFKPTLDLGLSLHPGTQQVAVVTGASDWDKSWRARAEDEFRGYEGTLKFNYLVGLTNAELEKTLAELPPHTIVSFVTSVQDRLGNTHDNVDVLRQIAPRSSSPIYGTTEAQLGNGIVGGMILSYEALGVAASKMGLRILAGENPDSIPPHVVPTAPMFDGRELRRWRISEASLPPASVIQFAEPTVWEEYGWYLLPLSGALTIETLLIGWMILLGIRRRQAEAENLLLNSRVVEIVSNVPGVVWESRIDPRTNIRTTTFISDYVQKFLGYTAREWLEMPPGFGLRIAPDEDQERIKRESEAVIETGKDGVSEFRWRTKDGAIRWAENHMSPIFDGDSKVVGLRGVALDVTDRKLAEENARQAEERDRAILAAIPDMMFLQTRDGVYLDYHSNEVSDLAVPPESFLGKNMFDVLPPDMAKQFAEAFGRAEPTGKPQVIEYPMEVGGTDRWFEARIVGSGENILTVVHEITDRKKALDDLLQSEERFSKAFDSNPQPMTLTTMADGRYLLANDSFLAMCGYPREEVIGRSSQELGIWDRPEARGNLIKELKAKGSIVNMETTCRTRGGDRRTLLLSAETLLIGGEECLLLAASDITEMIAARQAEAKAHEELVIAHEEVNRLKNQLEAENIYLQEELQQDNAFGDIVGQSSEIKYVLYKVSQVAPLDTTVLITGETGTGKELVARAIHEASERKDRPLIKVNCAALSPSLVESELFGHEKGSFTGAVGRNIGRFELANGGTLLLDEIGELPLDVQSKLLRVLQEGEFERVGSSRTTSVDVRIIAATNRNLGDEVQKRKFREDLLYRLNVYPITLPPLRNRVEDVPLLTDHFVRLFSRKYGKEIAAVASDTMMSLRSYSWPGNIRELANVIERAVITSRGPVLRINEDFLMKKAEIAAAAIKPLEDMERDYITQVLDDLNWRIDGPRGVAHALGINPSTLRGRIAKLGIRKPTS